MYNSWYSTEVLFSNAAVYDILTLIVPGNIFPEIQAESFCDIQCKEGPFCLKLRLFFNSKHMMILQ